MFEIREEVQILIRDRVILAVRIVGSQSGGKASHRAVVDENQMSRNLGMHMRVAHEFSGFLQSHITGVDVVRPHVADVLLALEIVLRDFLHGIRQVPEVIQVILVSVLFALTDINDDHYDDNRYDQDICKHNSQFLHL